MTYRPAGGRARLAQVCLAALAFLALAGALHWLSGFDLAQRAEVGRVRADETQAFDGDTARLAILGLAGLVVTAIAWFAWLHRSVTNAWALGRPTRFTPGWSVGWWFVPFANIVRPYQILRSLVDELGWPMDTTVLAWWGCYLAAGAVSNFGSFQRPADLAGFRVLVGTFLLADVLRIVAAALAIWLVGEVQMRSESLARERSTAMTPAMEPPQAPLAT